MCVDKNMATGKPCDGHPSGRGPCGGRCAECPKFVGNSSTTPSMLTAAKVLAGVALIKILGR